MAGPYARATPILALGLMFLAAAACGVDIDSEQLSARAVTTIGFPAGDSLHRVGPALAFSRTGNLLVYFGRHQNVTRLYLQAVSGGEERALVGTEGAANPFFSPDGHWLGFFADGKLKKLLLDDANSTAPTVICDAGSPRGASWGDDGQIIFAITSRPGLLRVSADGGEAQPLTRPTNQKDFGHRGPHVLPGGKAVLFTIDTGVGFDHARIATLSLETGEIRPLIASGHSPSYAAGHLVFARDYTLFAARFDLATLAVTGPAVPAMSNVSMNAFYGSHISASRTMESSRTSRDETRPRRNVPSCGSIARVPSSQ